MRKSILMAALFMMVVTAQAADIFYYQSRFTANVDSFKTGLKDKAAFDNMLNTLNTLQTQLAGEKDILKKDPLLSDMKAVYAMIGELSPNPKSYLLTLQQKKTALDLLGIAPKLYSDTIFNLPIYEIHLWNDKYTAFMIDNKSDSMMYVFKLTYFAQKKFSSSAGSVEAGVSHNCSRGILKAFGSFRDVKFAKVKCDQELNVTKFIQPEVVQPKVEKYPEPDYLSPQQKQAMKKKEIERLKKEKEKQKKEALKEKEQKKKEMEKERLQAKTQMMKELEAKKAQQAEMKKQKDQEKSTTTKKKK